MILLKALYSLNINPLFINFLLYALAIIIYVVYTQLILIEFSICSDLVILSLVPIKPSQLNNEQQAPNFLNNTNIKRKYLTKKERAEFTVPTELKEILIGLTLGDLFIEKGENAVNARLRFEQSTIHEDYINFLYKLFSRFCNMVPMIKIHAAAKKTGKVYSSIYFSTYSLPCFTEYYNIFYLDGRKIVPQNIGKLLTPSVLAYWLCDDGNWHKVCQYVVLCTHSFTLAEVNLLAEALNKNFDLKCYVNKHTSGGYIIIIPAYSVTKLQGLLKDIMPPMMLYKIGL